MMNGTNVNDQLNNLINTYSDDLKRVAWRYVRDQHLAEDIVQEVFLKCVMHKEQLKDMRSIKSWLITVTKNQCKDYISSKYHQNVIPSSELFSSYQITPELELMTKHTREEIYHNITKLPGIYQEVLYLFYVKDLKLLEIQQHLNINISTVKTRLLRARRLLKSSILVDHIYS
ncbi:sigma-70 family RNA polymerase sigma factor [Bacillus sp. ISL-47]|uniref:RNA polymerase sigma factor n=1 Tax=Bacillus sp. ISL-47 TaxID=2819130 RepID=UPI001BE64C32|nr:sigma-70 family RNA polymerase sigma factor [Bacillus sp. ISL-47]MBT2688343.1 sigma-70 family RNA polymerase sigma factor [Bacillus sp. ISL-47]MBT2710546.1 sigma-70 family RNA polymerase sigma factor [Pseudomonas sp. ISL-84]